MKTFFIIFFSIFAANTAKSKLIDCASLSLRVEFVDSITGLGSPNTLDYNARVRIKHLPMESSGQVVFGQRYFKWEFEPGRGFYMVKSDLAKLLQDDVGQLEGDERKVVKALQNESDDVEINILVDSLFEDASSTWLNIENANLAYDKIKLSYRYDQCR